MNVDDEVNRLLHDAEHAEAGADFAGRIQHFGPAAEMRKKSKDLFKKALKLDPKRKCPAWKETTLRMAKEVK